eukprot:scaffold6428_cov332-Prasinococcus_capsulatus_cf.AAC.6
MRSWLLPRDAAERCVPRPRLGRERTLGNARNGLRTRGRCLRPSSTATSNVDLAQWQALVRAGIEEASADLYHSPQNRSGAAMLLSTAEAGPLLTGGHRV